MSIDVEFAIKKDIRNNPVIRDVDPRERREIRRTVAVAAVFVAMLLFSAWQHFRVVDNGYALARLRANIAEELSQGRQLRLELEVQRAPQRVEARAIHDLHMVPSTPATTIVIERTHAAAPTKSIIAAVR